VDLFHVSLISYHALGPVSKLNIELPAAGVLAVRLSGA